MGDIPDPHIIDYTRRKKEEGANRRPSIHDRPPEIPTDRPSPDEPKPTPRRVVIDYGDDNTAEDTGHKTFDINDLIGDRPSD